MRVWMHVRPKTDSFYAGMLCFPGGVIRTTDHPGDGMFAMLGPVERAQKDEIRAEFLWLDQAGITLQHNPRGPHLHVVLFGELKIEPRGNGKWIAVPDFLVTNTIHHQRKFVDMVVRAYLERLRRVNHG